MEPTLLYGRDKLTGSKCIEFQATTGDFELVTEGLRMGLILRIIGVAPLYVFKTQDPNLPVNTLRNVECLRPISERAKAFVEEIG